jgi:hypothetical protein
MNTESVQILVSIFVCISLPIANYNAFSQSYQSLNSPSKPTVLLCYLIVWIVLAETINLDLPSNKENLGGYVLGVSQVVHMIGWIVYTLIQPRVQSFKFPIIVLSIYILQLGTYVYLESGIIEKAFVGLRAILVFFLIITYLCTSISPCDNDLDESMIGFTPPTTWTDYYHHAQKIYPFVIPRGLKWKVVMGCAGLCVVVGRVVNVLVPIEYKRIIDTLSGYIHSYLSSHRDLNSKNGVQQLLSGEALAEKVWGNVNSIPFSRILFFVLLRVLGGGTGLITTLQDGLWIPVSQFTTKTVATAMLHHLHHLPLSFHLSRKTGEILRVQSRGVSSIVSIVSSVWFKVVPTLCDVLVACIYFSVQFDKWFGFIVFSTMGFYIYVTVQVTEWRTQYRRRANRLENEMEGQGVDSLLNYESVKYFNAEAVEIDRYSAGFHKLM